MESILATRRPRLAAEEQQRASKGVDLIGLANLAAVTGAQSGMDAHLT